MRFSDWSSDVCPSDLQFGDPGGDRAVGAPFHALQVFDLFDVFVGENTLGRPGHRVQQLHALGSQLFIQEVFLGLVKFSGCIVASGQEGQAVKCVDGVFVGVVGKQYFTDLGLLALDGEFDLGSLAGQSVVSGKSVSVRVNQG